MIAKVLRWARWTQSYLRSYSFNKYLHARESCLKLVITILVDMFSRLHGARRFISIFTTGRHWILSCAHSAQSAKKHHDEALIMSLFFVLFSPSLCHFLSFQSTYYLTISFPNIFLLFSPLDFSVCAVCNFPQSRCYTSHLRSCFKQQVKSHMYK
jgi:hypothetical protein